MTLIIKCTQTFVCIKSYCAFEQRPSLCFGEAGDADAGFDESEWAASEEFPCDPPGGGVDVSGGINPSLTRFFCFILLFWNQIWINTVRIHQINRSELK